MKNIISFASLFACLFVLVFACREKNDPPSVYENCCGTVPTVDSVLLDTTGWPHSGTQYAEVYVPNLFIPSNPSGVDHSFIVFVGNGTQVVNLARITADNGEVYFEKKNFFPVYANFSPGWNGVKPDGSTHTGPFNYEFEIKFLDGQVKAYKGQACAFRCHDAGFPSEKLPDCFLPSQNNGNGGPNQNSFVSKDCF